MWLAFEIVLLWQTSSAQMHSWNTEFKVAFSEDLNVLQLFVCCGGVCVHTNLWWPCADQEIRVPVVLPLFLKQALAAVTACLLYLRRASWGICSGREGWRTWIGLLAARISPWGWHSREMVCIIFSFRGLCCPFSQTALQTQCSCYSCSFKEWHHKTESVAIFFSITWTTCIFFLE